ncbi:MAG: transporter [Pseudonocardiales bacterium]|nr:transporter [Pseudonocardiales bacterium]
MISLFEHDFMRHALLAGSAAAIACGLVGWFLVVRGQVFAGDALSHVAFTGALAALSVGFSARWGLFVSAVVVAGVMSLIGGRRVADDVVIGNLFAWVLGIGVLLLSIYARGHADNAGAGVRVLFGSVFGLSGNDALEAALVCFGLSLVMLVLARPLLFASLSPSVAGAQGVPVALIGFAFLAVAGLTAAETVQVTGALPLLGLLAGPAAAAQLLTDRPYASMALSVAISLASVWLGLIISYYVAEVPPSSGIVGCASLAYLGAGCVRWVRRRRRVLIVT